MAAKRIPNYDRCCEAAMESDNETLLLAIHVLQAAYDSINDLVLAGNLSAIMEPCSDEVPGKAVQAEDSILKILGIYKEVARQRGLL